MSFDYGLRLAEHVFGGGTPTAPGRMVKSPAEEYAEMIGFEQGMSEPIPAFVQIGGGMAGFLLAVLFLVPRLQRAGKARD